MKKGQLSPSSLLSHYKDNTFFRQKQEVLKWQTVGDGHLCGRPAVQACPRKVQAGMRFCAAYAN